MTIPQRHVSRISQIVRYCLGLHAILLIFALLSNSSLFAQETKPFPKTVRLAYSYDVMYHKFEDGKSFGILLPFIDILKKEFNVEVEFVKLDWQEAFEQLESGEIDFYGLAGLNSESRKKFHQIGPLFREKGAIVTREDAPLHSLINLRGKKVGILHGSMLAEPISKYVDSDEMFVRFSHLQLMLDALEQGKIDCLITIGSTKIEILERRNLEFEIPIQDFTVEQGILCGRDELKPLVDKLNDYLKTEKGNELITRIPRIKQEAILQNHKRFLAKEIEQVRKYYPVVNMYDCGTFYPLSYKERATYHGIVPEINRIFTQLTDVDVKIGEFDCEQGGITAALEKIKDGQCHVALGGYANVLQNRDTGLSFSPELWTDAVRFYSYKEPKVSLNQAKIGVPPNLEHYFFWSSISEFSPTVYARTNLITALKKRQIDAVVLEEMCFNYQHAVRKDFHFRELDAPTAEIHLHLIYNEHNTALNRLFDESIRLYRILYPDAQEHWKKMAERANRDYIQNQKTTHQRMILLGIAMLVLIAAIVLILRRFVKYDLQIRKLLHKQQNFDLAWVDLRTRKFISKGNHPFFRAWGLKFSGSVCSLDEMNQVFHRDLEKEYHTDLKVAIAAGLNVVVTNGEIVSPQDGQTKYYRRYFHYINDHQFMLCLQDINTQHESEQQEQFLIQLFAAFKDGLLFIDKNLNILQYNQAMADLFPQYDPQKKFCYDCFRNETSPCENCPVCQTFVDGQKHSRVEFSPEINRWIELNSYPILNIQTGEVDRVLEFVQDITEKQEREAELESRKKFFEAILNASNDGIVAISDGNAEGTHVNRRIAEMFDGAGADFFSNATPDIRAKHKSNSTNPEEIYEARDRNRITHEPQQGTLFFHDGRIYQWRLDSVPTGLGTDGYTRIWTFHDATSEFQAARKIRENEQYLQRLFETMPSGLGSFDVVRDEQSNKIVDFQIIGVNQAFERIIDSDRTQLLGKSLKNFFFEIQVISGKMKGTNIVEAFQSSLDGNAHTFHIYDANRESYQQIVVFEISSERIGCFVVDETDQMLSEMALRESEERYRTLFKLMPNGLALFDVKCDENGEPIELRYSQVNPALEKIDQLTNEIRQGKLVEEILPNICLMSEDYQRIETDEHWIYKLGRAAMRGESGTYMTCDERKEIYFRLTVFNAGPNQLGAFITDETARLSALRLLKESEHRMSSLFTSMTNGLVLLNVIRNEEGEPIDFQVTYANPAYCDSLGVTLEALTNQTFFTIFKDLEIVTQGFPDCWWIGLKLASKGISGTYHCYMREIPSPYQEFVIFPVGVDQVGMLMYDETYRVQSENRLKLMQLIIDKVSQPVFWLYLEGTVQYANDAAARAWGFKSSGIVPDGPVGEKAWMFDDSVSADNWKEFNTRFKDTAFQRFDTTMRRTDGTTFPASVTVNLLEQQGAPFYAACFHDLTDQTERIKAEQKALAKTNFLDHITHEIRTPLNGVIGITDLLLNTELTPQQHEYLVMAKMSGQQLLTIVSNILDFSLIDSNKLVLKEKVFDLREFVESLRLLMASMVEKQNPNIDVEFIVHSHVPHYIVGDEARLQQVIFNLLDNALKFTHQGRITMDISIVKRGEKSDASSLKGRKKQDRISVGAERSQGNEKETNSRFLKFIISDTGIGFSMEKMNDLFESFSMGDASFSRKYGGTGLGLSISRGLILKMKGRIHVESEINVGSTFDFTIPLKEAERPESSHEERTPSTKILKAISVHNSLLTTHTHPETLKAYVPENVSVLVVEDNRINRIVTGEILKQAGYRYEFAENGLQACQAVADKKFDFVLMDCQMPVMDGFEATRRIRKMESGNDEEFQAAHQGHVPIVALTANALVGDEQNCIEAGMDAFCSKPVNTEHLLHVIKQWTEGLQTSTLS